MRETILAMLKIEFAGQIIQYQSLILLALVTYWLAARWSAVKERFSPQALGPMMLVLILGFSAFTGIVFTVEWGTEFMLLAFTIALGIGLSMCDTTISICFFIALLFLRPWEIKADNDDYFGLLPKLSMSLCVANAILVYASKKAFNFRWSRPATYLVLFAGWCLLTTFKGMNPDIHQSVFFDNFFKSVFLFILILNVMTSREEIAVVTWSIVITMFGVGLASIYRTAVTAAALEHIVEEKVRLIGFGAFENSNDIAALMIMVLPFALVPAVRRETKPLLRLFSLLMCGVVLECVRLSQSRGALLGMLAIVGLMILATMKNRKFAIVIASIGVLGVLAVGQMSGRSEADLTESKEIRLVYIQTGMMMGLKNPIFGVGFDGYADNFLRYQTGVVDALGHRTAHNSWVLAFGETGFIGLLLFAAVYFASLLLSLRFARNKPEFFLAIMGYGIAMTFLSHTYFIYPYLLYALASASAPLNAPRLLPGTAANAGTNVLTTSPTSA